MLQTFQASDVQITLCAGAAQVSIFVHRRLNSCGASMRTFASLKHKAFCQYISGPVSQIDEQRLTTCQLLEGFHCHQQGLWHCECTCSDSDCDAQGAGAAVWSSKYASLNTYSYCWILEPGSHSVRKSLLFLRAAVIAGCTCVQHTGTLLKL